MTEWVRLWRDMPTDPKWRVIARRSGRPVSEVISVFIFMMTDAAEWEHRGRLGSWETESVAAALDMDEAHVEAIFDAMQGRVLDGDTLLGWEKRQPKREDDSKQRVADYRARQRDNSVTPCNAPVTHCNAPEEKRIDKIEIDKSISNNITPPTPRDILKECLSEQTASDIIAHRQAKRAKLTTRAARELVKAFNAHGDPEAAAAEMIARGWTGFKPEWMADKARGSPANNTSSRNGFASLWLKSNGYTDAQSGEARLADQDVSEFSRLAVDERGDGGCDSGGVSGNLIELYATNR